VTQWETTIGLICILAGLLAFGFDQNWRTFSLCILLFWQGSLYLSAPLYSLLSLKREAALGAAPARVAEQGKPVLEQLAARWVVAFSMVLIGAFSLIRFLPSPQGLPDYVRFLPLEEASELAPELTPEPTPQPTPDREREAGTPAAGTPAAAMATVTVESANCRAKPRGGADLIIFLYKGEEVEIVGRNADILNPWWYIKIPNSSDHCWLWGMSTQITGTVDEIPIIQ
jgi:hypothetical protein